MHSLRGCKEISADKQTIKHIIFFNAQALVVIQEKPYESTTYKIIEVMEDLYTNAQSSARVGNQKIGGVACGNEVSSTVASFIRTCWNCNSSAHKIKDCPDTRKVSSGRNSKRGTVSKM